MKILEILAVNTTVWLHDGDIKGQIVAACIRDNDYINYEIAYWKGKEHEKLWLTSSQFTTQEPQKRTIGFKE